MLWTYSAGLLVVSSITCVGSLAQPVAIVGATIINVSRGGTIAQDLPDAVILIDNGHIIAVGPRSKTKVPSGVKQLNEAGKFVIPGLVDGFSGMQNQAEASVELYEGVTTIVGTGDDRRGTLFLAADPSPHVYLIDSVGSTDDWSLLRGNPDWRARLADRNHPHELSPEETEAQLKAIANAGTRVLWIGHNITPDNARRIIQQARALNMMTYGEFFATPYEVGIEAGVSSLLHMSRFELGLAPPELVAAGGTDPYSEGAKAAYANASLVDPAAPEVARYGDSMVMHGVAVMPTLSLYYLMLPGHRNLWTEPAAAILNPLDLGKASDPNTGELSDVTTEQRANVQRVWALDKAILARHPIVLAGSGATWAGTMPGISLHVELELLVRAELSPRQALAAATNNYAEHFGWIELGSVTPGKRADLVVLDADPTVDIRNVDRISEVFLAGERLDRSSLLKRPNPRK